MVGPPSAGPEWPWGGGVAPRPDWRVFWRRGPVACIRTGALQMR